MRRPGEVNWIRCRLYFDLLHIDSILFWRSI
jgi:hypothetical protein